MSRNVTIASLKVQAALWDAQENLRRLEPLVREAAAKGADIILTPECFLSGYNVDYELALDREAFIAASDRIDGPLVGRVANWAKELGVFIALGFSEIDGERFLNTLAIFDRRGELVGKYSKTHLGRAPDNRELELFVPGDALPVFETDVGKLGALICMDRYWAEAALTLSGKGAEIILNPAATNQQRAQFVAGNLKRNASRENVNTHKRVIFRTRAWENSCVWVESHAHQGFIIGSNSAILATGDPLLDEDEVLLATVDLEKVKNSGGRQLIADLRRPELYDL